jgi:hypothetical protein
MSSNPEFTDFDVFEKEFTPNRQVLDKGYRDMAKFILEDIARMPIHLRSQRGAAGAEMLEQEFFKELIFRDLALTADRAITLGIIRENILINGEDLEGPLFTIGTFNGLKFVHAMHPDNSMYEPVFGLEIGDYQIVTGERPESSTQGLLVPILDLKEHQFN